MRILFLLAVLALPGAVTAQTITTQGPGDGCAPDTDGVVYPDCLSTRLSPHNSTLDVTGGAGLFPSPAQREPLPTAWTLIVSPGAENPAGTDPVALLLPWLSLPYTEEGRPSLSLELNDAGYGMVDIHIRQIGGGDDSVAGEELVGRFAPHEGGLRLHQLHRRILCYRGVSENDRCI